MPCTLGTAFMIVLSSVTVLLLLFKNMEAGGVTLLFRSLREHLK